MNIYRVDSGLTSWWVHACTVGTAINRTPFGKLQRTISIRIELVKKDATDQQWLDFKAQINANHEIKEGKKNE